MAEEISNQQSLGYIDFVPADFDFAALMAELRTSYERKSSERGLSLDFPAQELEAVNGDYQLPRESLEIFLDNALDASDSGAVYFSVSKPSENEYKFEVRDGGPGLSAEALAQILICQIWSAFLLKAQLLRPQQLEALIQKHSALVKYQRIPIQPQLVIPVILIVCMIIMADRVRMLVMKLLDQLSQLI